MIYTSYFANMSKLDKSKCVAICRWKPKWYTGAQYIDVAPTESMIRDYKSNTGEYKAKVERYIKDYNQSVLSKLDPAKVFRDLDGKILLCYEKPTDFCHRHLLAEWLREHGYPCKEWGFEKEPKIQEPQKPLEEVQLSLF